LCTHRTTFSPSTSLFRSLQVAAQRAQRLETGHRQRLDTLQAIGVKVDQQHLLVLPGFVEGQRDGRAAVADVLMAADLLRAMDMADRKSTRLNSSHVKISY